MNFCWCILFCVCLCFVVLVHICIYLWWHFVFRAIASFILYTLTHWCVGVILIIRQKCDLAELWLDSSSSHFPHLLSCFWVCVCFWFTLWSVTPPASICFIRNTWRQSLDVVEACFGWWQSSLLLFCRDGAALRRTATSLAFPTAERTSCRGGACRSASHFFLLEQTSSQNSWKENTDLNLVFQFDLPAVLESF